ncbi:MULTISPECIES: hypothetical protein [Cryobacterium]|uniref:hypothetical protein n=1 Tax=Cryobacterium TaxID=69578 RepID=UPI001F543703|nr:MULTISPECIES: hypothetical protein [Cryobacterium]
MPRAPLVLEGLRLGEAESVTVEAHGGVVVCRLDDQAQLEDGRYRYGLIVHAFRLGTVAGARKEASTVTSTVTVSCTRFVRLNVWAAEPLSG